MARGGWNVRVGMKRWLEVVQAGAWRRGGETVLGKEAYRVRVKYVSSGARHKTSRRAEVMKRASCAHSEKGDKASRTPHDSRGTMRQSMNKPQAIVPS